MRLRTLQVSHRIQDDYAHPVWIFLFDEVAEDRAASLEEQASNLRSNLEQHGCAGIAIFTERVDLDSDLAETLSITDL